MQVTRLISRVRAAIRPRRPRPVILMYHRVAVVQHDPWGLAVHPERFEEQIAYLKRHRTPMSMDELVDRLRSKTLPADAVAVTFDDGYRDNLVNAKPVLARHSVPATLFLATGFINQITPFWWDELATMILASTQAIRDQQLWPGEAGALDWGDPEPSDIACGWRVSDEPRTARQNAYLAIWRKLQRATAEDREVAMNTLRRHLGTAQEDPLGKPMSSDEIGAFLSDGQLELGAHTVTHPALTFLSRRESRQEIDGSVHRCRELATKCVNGFAYPYGDMSLEVRSDVATLGFSWACSTEGGFVDGKQADIYALPRVAVPNAPIGTFVGLTTA
jgi:peptidoglycan/xylan/chitin deacetylase (PgdA/CDA1 family)